MPTLALMPFLRKRQRLAPPCSLPLPAGVPHPPETKSPAGTLIQRGPSDEIWVQNLWSVQRLRSTATSVNRHGDHTLQSTQVCKGTSELPSPSLAAVNGGTDLSLTGDSARRDVPVLCPT